MRPASSFLATVLPTALLLGAAGAEELHVLNWKGYGADEPWAVERFEAETGHDVINDFFNSEQEMLTKLRTNPGLYDVVMINAAFTGQAIEEGLIQPVDVSAIPNAAGVSEDKLASPMLGRGGEAYGVPWTWGLTALAIHDGAFETPPDSVEVMWDEAHEGRVVLRDDAVEAVQFAAIATGQDINAIEDMEAVRAKLEALMSQVRTFWSSENDWNQLVAAGQIDVGTYWSGSAERARTQFDLPVSFVVPQEGAVGWLDAFSIPAGSDNVEGALAFIDCMLSPDFYAEWNDRVGAPVSANDEALARLSEDAFNRRVMGDPELAARIQFQEPIAEEDRAAYLALWQAVKAGAD